jgi:5-hydroxyisourate hydrolase-like protein (transthyretin family)
MKRDCRGGVVGEWSKPARSKSGSPSARGLWVKMRHPRGVAARAVMLATMVGCVCGSMRAQATYRVAGIVLNDADGTPLGRTRVSLAEVQDRRKAESIVTGADGRFEFRNVPQGKFSLEGARRKFLVTTYQWHEGFSTAIVTGAGLDTENLVLRMIPFGSVAGRVIDEAGEPVRNARMRLYMRNQQFGQDRVTTYGFANTDDEGKYEFEGLIPAEYFVSATGRPWYAVYPGWVDENGVRSRVETVAPQLNAAYATTFYNGATEAEGATPISVEKGARVTADIHFSPVPAMHVTLKARGNPIDGSVNWPSIVKMEFDGAGEPYPMEMIPGANPNEMEVNGVPPGRYSVGDPGSIGLRAVGQVDVSNDGQFIETKAPESMGTVKVKLKTARGEDVPQGMNLSLRNEKKRTIAFIPAVLNGDTVFEGVPPGKYALLVNVQQPPQYTVGRIALQGGEEVEGHDVTVGDGSTVEVNATLMAGVVSVEGVVKKDGKAMSGVMVALVPKEPLTHPERFRRDQSNLDGSFMVGGILPGKYTLIAVEDAWGFAWMKEGVLEKYLARGQDLTVGVLMNGTVVLPEAVEAQAR